MGISTNDTAAASSMGDALPSPPKFSSKLDEREYLKFRLAQAFRIFGMTIPSKLQYHITDIHPGNNGYSDGVAGHITVRVR